MGDTRKSLPQLHCYAALKETPIITRGNCNDCQICLVAKSNEVDMNCNIEPCSCNNCDTKHNSSTSMAEDDKPLKKCLLTAEALINIQQKTNISDNAIIEIAHCLRQNLGRGAIESNFKEHLKQAKYLLKEHFCSNELSFYINEKNGYENRVIVAVKDFDEFVKYILTHRELNPESHTVRIGLDGGGKFLKVCMNIYEIANGLDFSHKKRRRSLQSDFLNTGVKKSFLIAIVENISENYENIKKVLSQISNFNSTNFFMCNDLKATSLILGIQNASATYPCPMCEVYDLGVSHNSYLVHTQRTIGSIGKNATDFKNSNSRRSEAKNLFSCVELPLIPGNPDIKISDIIVPPALH